MDKELKLRKDIKVVYRDTAWCNDSVLEEWVPTTFPSLFPKRQALIWDSFRAHMSENTKKSQLTLADNHHFENNDLFVIDE